LSYLLKRFILNILFIKNHVCKRIVKVDPASPRGSIPDRTVRACLLSFSIQINSSADYRIILESDHIHIDYNPSF
ncbi:MAG: hypothetical protein KKD86_12670, partial [Bacteroidetes bacterium]|nr:hypothetical protein [Bacteroidota bacterium]